MRQALRSSDKGLADGVGLLEALWRVGVVGRSVLVRTRSQGLNFRGEMLEVLRKLLAVVLLFLVTVSVGIAGGPNEGLLSGGQRGVLMTKRIKLRRLAAG